MSDYSDKKSQKSRGIKPFKKSKFSPAKSRFVDVKVDDLDEQATPQKEVETPLPVKK